MKYFIIILFLANSLTVFSQTKQELGELLLVYGNNHQKVNYEIAKQNKNIAERAFSTLFLFYKSFISSQDFNSCSFEPSCSVYAIQSVKKQGFFVGTLDFIDRLCRCNGLSPEHYRINQSRTLLLDPVRDIHYHEL